ncbi:MAG: hypothetical protein HZB32_06705 [Nitrospirae bacterium]|nr:hypothetical protein [Nitrospirota bacterium]
MKKVLFLFAVIFPLVSYLAAGMVHAQEKRLGQKFIDAYSAKDEDAMRLLIKENKDGVPDEVESMMAYAVENKVGWMIDVCEKMATLYKEETGDSALLNKIEEAMKTASGKDPKLEKLKEEVAGIGKGQWSIVTLDYDEKSHLLKIEISVSPDVGMDINKKDVEKAGQIITKLLPEARGNVTWVSFGVGVASLLREENSKSWKTR